MLRPAIRRKLMYDDPETDSTTELDAAFEFWYHFMTNSDAGLNILAWGGWESASLNVRRRCQL